MCTCGFGLRPQISGLSNCTWPAINYVLHLCGKKATILGEDPLFSQKVVLNLEYFSISCIKYFFLPGLKGDVCVAASIIPSILVIILIILFLIFYYPSWKLEVIHFIVVLML